jgi:cyclase
MADLRELRSEHYTFEPIGDGIAFGRARREGTGLSNTGVLDLGGSTLVFDTSLTLRSAREIRRAAETFTRRPPSLSVNSHWHLDHTVGNQVFADRPIYASRRTIEILLEKRTEIQSELTRAKLEADLAEFEKQRAAAKTEAGRAPFDAVIRINRTLLDELVELRFTLPTAGFDTELRFPGERGAYLRTFGSGHTDSDTILFLPEERILFAGDLIVEGNHPNLLSGDPEHWLVVLDEIERLRPERIITGHGPMGSLETVAVMRDYLRAVLDLARHSGTPEVPARFRAWDEPDQFTGNVAYVRSRMTSGGTPPAREPPPP